MPPTSSPGSAQTHLQEPPVPPEQLSEVGKQGSKGRPQGAQQPSPWVPPCLQVCPCLSSPEAANIHTRHISLPPAPRRACCGPPGHCLLLPSQDPQDLPAFSSHPSLEAPSSSMGSPRALTPPKSGKALKPFASCLPHLFSANPTFRTGGLLTFQGQHSTVPALPQEMATPASRTIKPQASLTPLYVPLRPLWALSS